MLFYHSFDNVPFRAIIVSGLLAALNNFSEVEIQEQGIQSIEMHDIRWTYLVSSNHNLLLIAADDKEQNSKIMRSQLETVLKLFVIKYHIDLKYWEDGAANLKYFEKFEFTLKSLTKEWKTPTMISHETKIHFYKVIIVLQELLNEGFVEVDEKPNTTYWRLKNVENKS